MARSIDRDRSCQWDCGGCEKAAPTGSGKTTLMRYLTLKYTQRKLPKEMRSLIPVLLLLRFACH